jgi:hypothetical protein
MAWMVLNTEYMLEMKVGIFCILGLMLYVHTPLYQNNIDFCLQDMALCFDTGLCLVIRMDGKKHLIFRDQITPQEHHAIRCLKALYQE